MICVDCRTNVIGSIPGHLYISGRCKKCHKLYEIRISLKEEVEKIEKEVKEKEGQVERQDAAEKEEEMGRFDMMDFD